MSTFREMGKMESVYPVSRVQTKTEVKETQLPTFKKDIKESQNYSGVTEEKSEEMEFKEEKIDEE